MPKTFNKGDKVSNKQGVHIIAETSPKWESCVNVYWLKDVNRSMLVHKGTLQLVEEENVGQDKSA